ncbi:MAG: hypothetical protein RBR86_00085 [Pseudobdellovibrionaceae bacterium]|jgi:hypothetical protein|nr:hypothetical protein [Pseudobdellovibrionaceae bacterium]
MQKLPFNNQQTLLKNKNAAHSFALIVTALIESGERDLAQSVFQSLLYQLEKPNEACDLIAEKFLLKRNTRDALPFLLKADEIDPQNVYRKFRISASYEEAGDTKNAEYYARQYECMKIHLHQATSRRRHVCE